MSKKNNPEQETKTPEQPAYVEELLKNGTVVLTAKTREELTEMVNNIPAECHYGAGAVGQDFEHRVLTLRIDIVNN